MAHSHPVKDRILTILRDGVPRTRADLERALGHSPDVHPTQLRKQGLIDGDGKESHPYTITDAGRALFADGEPLHAVVTDAVQRFHEAHGFAREIIDLDGRIEVAKEKLKELKDLRDNLVSRLVAVTGAERQQTIFDQQAQEDGDAA